MSTYVVLGSLPTVEMKLTAMTLAKMHVLGLLLAVAATGCRVNDSGIGVTGAAGEADGAGDPGDPVLDAGGGTTETPDGPTAADTAAPADAAVALGGACVSDVECGSGICVAGLCCESRCNVACFTCAGATPGRCRPLPAQTSCGPTASCSGSSLMAAAVCNGAGMCVPGTPQACPGGLKCADGAHCLASCTRDTDCTGDLQCDKASGACQRPGKPLGADCRGDGATTECQSGFCADGVCCESACTGACLACLGSVTGATDGKCAFVQAGRHDPDCTREDPATCGEDGTCDGQGKCAHWPDGTACGARCCATNQGKGNGSVPCTFMCKGGTCDRNNPVLGDRCGLASCCCAPSPEQPATCRPLFQCDGCQ
jgi:hypothetical protein